MRASVAVVLILAALLGSVYADESRSDLLATVGFGDYGIPSFQYISGYLSHNTARMSTEEELKVEVVTSSTVIGEGPHWDEDKQVLYFVDVFGSEVRKYVPATKTETKAKIGNDTISFVVPIQHKKNKFLIGKGRHISILTWDGVSNTATSVEDIATVDEEDGKRENRLNDAKADPTGRLWAGTMGPKKGPGDFLLENGSLFSLSKGRKLTRHLTNISCSNGLAWSNNQKNMYYIDTFKYTVDIMAFDATKGSIRDRRVFFDFKANNVSGIPDGMTIDTKNNLYIACYGGSQVIVVNPNGKLIKHIPIPAYRVTSVAFGGKNLDELYVTSATEDITEEEKEQYPLAGCTFIVKGLGVTGLPGQPVII